MSHLVSLQREKKSSMCFRSLFKSMESIIDFANRISSLVSLIAFIMFNDLIGWKTTSIELIKEI